MLRECSIEEFEKYSDMFYELAIDPARAAAFQLRMSEMESLQQLVICRKYGKTGPDPIEALNEEVKTDKSRQRISC